MDASQSSPGHATLLRDLRAGFLVFLIALPLCLGIALASNFPPVAGIMTAVVGGLVATWAGSADLTIKGPAAGLIVIALGSFNELGYEKTLAVGVMAASVQIVFALVRAGRFGEIFPASVVHGMLAAIGVIIMSKQLHTMVGVKPEGHEPLELLAEIPRSLAGLNPEIALIGGLSLLILLVMPRLPWPALRRVPGPLAVLAAAVPLAGWFDLAHQHPYAFLDEVHEVGPYLLVQVSGDILAAVTWPDFSEVFSTASLKYVLLFSLIGSIESLLSAKAVDILDPLKRKSDLNKDLLAVGIGNLVASFIGGLPMISEIVRSKANIDNGAVTRKSNFFHAVFLLGFVALLPGVLSSIPLAALAAMLVFTGLRLASPAEFRHTWHVGREQFLVFVVTLVTTLATDLLVGVIVGIALEFSLQVVWTLRPRLRVATEGDVFCIAVRSPTLFSNYLTLHQRIHDARAAGTRAIRIDFSESPVVDHTTMERLTDMQAEMLAVGLSLELVGLDRLVPVSHHPLAARRSLAP